MTASQKTRTRNLQVILGLQRTLLGKVQVLGETALQGPVCPISLCREFLCFVSVLRSVDFPCIFVFFIFLFFTELFLK